MIFYFSTFEKKSGSTVMNRSASFPQQLTAPLDAMARRGPPADLALSVMDRLKAVYNGAIRPLEEAYMFGEFYSPVMKESDFDAKPMVLLLGQYSVGKTSFIRYLIGRDFPGARIGPEPTTDRFNAVMGGPEDRIVPGNALAVDQSMPFSSLTKFGTEFLNKFQASMCNSPVLEKLYFVDTPGVLSGEKQKLGRSYDFVKVTEWFAQRADLILLLFDAHKLDISDEFQAAIKALKGQDDKIRVVLNKADKVTSQQLMRVYGAMMWSLGKVVATPEVARVYIGSFWDGPCQNPSMEPFFKAEQADLLKDLHVRVAGELLCARSRPCRGRRPRCAAAGTPPPLPPSRPLFTPLRPSPPPPPTPPSPPPHTRAGAAPQRRGAQGERAGEARAHGARARAHRGPLEERDALFRAGREAEGDAGKHGGPVPQGDAKDAAAAGRLPQPQAFRGGGVLVRLCKKL